jgi:hypothetical protein
MKMDNTICYQNMLNQVQKKGKKSNEKEFYTALPDDHIGNNNVLFGWSIG